MEIIDILEASGATLNKVIIGHIDAAVKDQNVLVQIAERGCYIEWDLIGEERSFYDSDPDFDMPTDAMRMDQIATLIADIDAYFYVIECMANVTKEQIKQNTIPLVNIIRDKHPTTPILFVENIMYESGYLDPSVNDELKEEDKELKHQYNIMVHNDIQNLFYGIAYYFVV